MGQDWRFSSRRAREELGYESRPLDDTLQATIDWYLELIEAGAFADSRGPDCPGGRTPCGSRPVWVCSRRSASARR